MIKWILTGLAAMFLVGVGAAVALVVAPERIAIVVGGSVGEERVAPMPPPRDRTDELLAEITTLREGLVLLGAAIDEASTRDDAARARMTALTAAFEAATARQDAFRAQVREYMTKKPVVVVPPPVKKQIPVANPVVHTVAKTVEKPLISPEKPTPLVKKRKTLAELLAAKHAVDPRDRRTTWRLLPGNARIGFDGRSTVHNFTARSDHVSGDLQLHWNDLGDGAGGELVVQIKSLDSGDHARDEEIRKHLGGGKHPTVVCRILSLTPDGEARGAVRKAQAKLRFAIHGKTREINAPVTLTLTPQQRVHVQGELKLKMSDFDIRPKAKFGLIKVDDEVAVWWDLYAEPQRAGK